MIASRGGYAVNPRYAFEEMQLVKSLWGRDHSRRIRHFILSFGNRNFKSLYGPHADTEHLHLHPAVNTVAYTDEKIYAEGLSDWRMLREYIQGLLLKWYEA